MEITKAYVETLIKWSAPRSVTNSRGPCMVRTGVPNGAFWQAWRANKLAMQALKVHPKPTGSDNQWEVNWYLDTESTPAEATGPLQDVSPAVSTAHPAPKTASGKPYQVPKHVQARNERVWSAEQKAIFDWFRKGQGSLVVRARAGTGKTTTIKTAFTYAKEERMLYAVFNKKNQVEASEAISDHRVEIKTLHSVGFSFIQQVWPGVRPVSEVEVERVEKVCGEQAPQQVKTQVRKLVGFAKNILVEATLQDLIDLADDRDIECPAFAAPESGGFDQAALANLALQVLELSKTKDPQGRISFDDMVWLPVAMKWTRAWYDLVVVDEAQDMNLPQLLMAISACKPDGRLCVVGDDRQAIYHFRGAASDGMDMMKAKLKAAELGLTTTYRCPKAVVALASAIVPDYKAADAAPDGLVETLAFQGIENRLQVGDAVLSRANAPLMPVCLSLLRKGTAARIEGRDIGKALQEIVEKLHARTVPQFITKIEAWGEKQIARFAGAKNFETKSQQVGDQVQTLIAIAEGASGVSEISSRITAIFQDTVTGSKPAVVLSTVHKAKGLEWSRVYLLSSTFNRKRSQSAPPMSEEAEAARAREESNIYYVALTRSKEHLVLVQGEVRRK